MLGSGLFFKLVREIDKAAQKEIDSDQQAVMAGLRALHHQLEAGQIDEDQFDEQEEMLLARLDELKRMRGK